MNKQSTLLPNKQSKSSLLVDSDLEDDVSIDSVDNEFINNISWDTNSQELLKSKQTEKEFKEFLDDNVFDFQLHNFKKNYIDDPLPERLRKKNWVRSKSASNTPTKSKEFTITNRSKSNEKKKEGSSDSEDVSEISAAKKKKDEDDLSSYDFEYHELKDFKKHIQECNVLKGEHYKRMVEQRLLESQQTSILKKYTEDKRTKRRREKQAMRSVS
jgi:hypothetical protein